jgi:hypothetical protein
MVKLDWPRHTADDFGAEKQNAQRDAGVERQRRKAGIAERRDRERDAVRHRERGDRLDQHPSSGNDQQQPQHEQQVVRAEQDVADAFARVSERAFPPTLRRGDLEPGLTRTGDRRAGLSVGRLHANQHVGDRQLQARELDAFSCDTAAFGT